MSVLGRLGLGPTYHELGQANGDFIVHVQKPNWLDPVSRAIGDYPFVRLNPDQYSRFKKWRTGVINIDAALPDLSKEDREILQTGLSYDEQARIFSSGKGDTPA